MKIGNILIVDDEEEIRDIYREVLEGSVVNILEAEDVEEAIDTLSKSSIHTILLDMKLIGGSGLELLKTFNAFKVRIPVIVISAYRTTDIATEAIELGAIDFLNKPINPEELLSMVKDTIKVGLSVQNLADEYHMKLDKEIGFLKLKYNKERLKNG